MLAALTVGVCVASWIGYQRLERTLVERFSGRRWAFPSRVYSDAFPLYPGLSIATGEFGNQLTRRGYTAVARPLRRPGEYREVDEPRRVEIYLRAFDYATFREPGRVVFFEIDHLGSVRRIRPATGGNEIYEVYLEPTMVAGLHGEAREDRREMKLDEIPAPLVRAVIAIEDRRFFEHSGIDVRGLARAFLVNVRAMDVRQGGSTLTQQLMKNFFLTERRTLARKLQEIVMALMAERRFPKSQILENYMNEIYMGQRHGVAIHGIWEASEFYFGREPRDLTMGQVAALAGMIRAPNYYSPHAHPERASERRDTVLGVLRELGDIDERTYLAARAEPLGAVPPPPAPTGAPYFVDFVRRDLESRFPAEMLTSEGYRIFTTLDPDLQRIAERAVADGIQALEKDFPAQATGRGSPLQGALIALNPRTGAVLAMVGGRDYASSQYNRSVDMRRQPGSVFKPIVYLAALGSERIGEVHYQPTTIVLDEPFLWSYDGGTWSPDNYESRFYGPVSVRTALEQSLNAATARIAEAVGIDHVRDLAVRLGMNSDLPAFPSIALGGWEASPLEIARVYSVFANGGVAAEPFAVQKVLDRQGKTVKGHRVAIRNVVPPQDAFLVTHLMQGVVERGTASAVRNFGLKGAVAAKTGTTNGYNDAWLAGYAPSLLAVVWVGFDRGESLGLSGSAAALPIWARFMRDALSESVPTTFEVPAGIVFADVDADSPASASPACRRVLREAFLEGEAPQDVCSPFRRWTAALPWAD